MASNLPIALMAVASLGACATPESASPGTDVGRRFPGFVEAMAADPSAPPGFSVAMVEGGRTVWERSFGTRHLGTGAALTLDDPMYTASVTKAYVGLLAARLDASGELPLTTTLRDVWPEATLPAPHDPDGIPASAFLSHSSGIEDGGLGYRYSFSGEYRPSEVPAHLAAHATPANRSFDYGNFGPVVYTAMVQARLGKPWQDVLRERVFEPLGLSLTSARLEDLPQSRIGRCHTRLEGRWQPVWPKPTPILNAGGGIYTSTRDAATFLKAFTSRGRSARGAVEPATLARTWQQVSAQTRDFFGFQRWGFGLGWDLSTYRGRQIVSRSGGYAGCRSLMAFLPDLGFGVLVFSNGDSGANLFNATLVQQAIDWRTGDPGAAGRAAERLAAYRSQAAAALAEADKLARPRWAPPERAAADLVGWYENKRLGRLAVELRPGGLALIAGVSTLLLSPAGPDAFKAVDSNTWEGPEDLSFRRDRAGRVTGLILDDDEYERLAD